MPISLEAINREKQCIRVTDLPLPVDLMSVVARYCNRHQTAVIIFKIRTILQQKLNCVEDSFSWYDQ